MAEQCPGAAGVRLAPHLDVDETVCADHKVPKDVETNAGLVRTQFLERNIHVDRGA